MKWCQKCNDPIEDMTVTQCTKCGTGAFIHDPKYLKQSVSQILIPVPQLETQTETPTSTKTITQNITEKQISLEDIHELIAAQNRTTHSVRAFVRFLFIQLTTLTLVAFIWNLASVSVDPVACANSGKHCNPVGALQTLAVIIWIIGVVWSSISGWSELKKSEITR